MMVVHRLYVSHARIQIVQMLLPRYPGTDDNGEGLKIYFEENVNETGVPPRQA